MPLADPPRPGTRPGPASHVAAIAALAGLSALVSPACAGPGPAAEPRLLRLAIPELGAPAALPPAASWVTSGGATVVGPTLDGGTLVLLGGRRALVGPDGSVRSETAPAPEPLLEVIEVPSAGGKRLVARGAMGIYRLDAPLDAPRSLSTTAGGVARLGSAPGLVVFWETGYDLPRYVDVETGAEALFPAAPALPAVAMLFVDALRGAALVEPSGVAVTSDGGVTWRAPAASRSSDLLWPSALTVRGTGAMVKLRGDDDSERPLDIDAPRIGSAEPRGAVRAGEPHLLRWIRLTGRDPLEAAVTQGLDDGEGRALVASHGLLARIHVATGAVVELAELLETDEPGGCGLARAGQAAWLACALPPDDTRYDPFGVMRVAFRGSRLTVDKPTLERNGWAEMLSSPSGGVLLLSPCDDEDASTCVRQPDGTWRPCRPPEGSPPRGVGPLLDGRVAFLRNLVDADDGPPADGGSEEEELPASTRPYIAAVGPEGEEKRIARLGVVGSGGEALHVASPIQEDVDRSLHFVLGDGQGLYAIVQPQGREPPRVHPLPGMRFARMGAGRGLAIGGESAPIQVSLDGGLSWSAVDTPAEARRQIEDLDLEEDPAFFTVGELGVRLGAYLRVGWGPSAPSPSAVVPADAPVELPVRKSPPATPETKLRCTTQAGPPRATPWLARAAELSPPASKGKTRDAAAAGRHESFVPSGELRLETAALLVEEPPRDRSSLKRWTVTWFDPTELGGAPRIWSGAAPASASSTSTVRAASSSGPRALFTVRSGSRHFLVRTGPGDRAELAEVSWDLLPGGGVVFGADRGESIAWLRDTSVVVWTSGRPPRAVAAVSANPDRWLGQPTESGVPLVASGSDWALMRELPLVAAPGPSRSPPALGLDGWAPAPHLRANVRKLPACGAATRGPSVLVNRARGGPLPVELDGAEHVGHDAVYAVRLGSAGACVASAVALLGPAGGARPVDTALTILSADLATRRAEAGARGIDAPRARRLTCELVPRP